VNRPLIGIDLGTTNSVVAIYEDGDSRVVANSLGHTVTPSVLATDSDGTLHVGAVARERQAAGHAVLTRFKPHMGEPKVFRVGSHKLRAEEASALVLKCLKEHAEAELGMPIDRAVVTVPAWFGEPQRKATVNAASLAGLTIERLINEPTAAALAYGVEQGDDPVVVGVIDLGGGTFDITILEIFDGVVDVMGSTGDTSLGGEDFTDALLAGAQRKADAIAALPQAALAFRASAELAKRKLSSGESAVIQLDEPIEVTPEEFREWTEPLVQRLKRCIREAMIHASVRRGGFDRVLLVGGAARMPVLAEISEELCGREAELADDLDHLVARGAAVQSALLARHDALSEVLVTDVLTHSLGIGVTKHYGEQVFHDRFDPVLSRGATLPASRKATYYTHRLGQTQVALRVYEGEARRVGDNHFLGELVVEGIPENEEEHEAFNVRFSHDVSGLLAVDVEVVSTGEKHALTLERSGRAMREEDLAAAKARLDQLCMHPRDLLPNRFVIERADRLIALVSGSVRSEIDDRMIAFEAVLEKGDPDTIKMHRHALETRLNHIARDFGVDY